MEVIGSVASVAQLASTVFKISKTLYEVGDALSNAPIDIKDLARDLETFAEELNLLSSLLDNKTSRYSEQVHRLTAKIIGDCATICVKIDKILRKLRSGSVLARIKWLYKEKEIMKLLTRLRDLKLSLMGMLSMLSALKADHMMDSLGIHSSSLLEARENEPISRERMVWIFLHSHPKYFNDIQCLTTPGHIRKSATSRFQFETLLTSIFSRSRWKKQRGSLQAFLLDKTPVHLQHYVHSPHSATASLIALFGVLERRKFQMPQQFIVYDKVERLLKVTMPAPLFRR